MCRYLKIKISIFERKITMKKTSEPENLLSLFVRCSHLIGRGHHHKGGRGGGRYGQGRILSILSKNTTMSQKNLNELLQVRPSSLSEILGKLETNGYISRDKDDEDQRNVNITITEMGKTIASEHAKKRQTMATELFKPLTENEQSELFELLSKLAEAWKEERTLEDTEHHHRGHEKGHHCEHHHHRGRERGHCGKHHHSETPDA